MTSSCGQSGITRCEVRVFDPPHYEKASHGFGIERRSSERPELPRSLQDECRLVDLDPAGLPALPCWLLHEGRDRIVAGKDDLFLLGPAIQIRQGVEVVAHGASSSRRPCGVFNASSQAIQPRTALTRRVSSSRSVPK